MIKWVDDLIKKLGSDKFYGKLTLHFESGNITFARREETLKPPQKKERGSKTE